MNTIASQFSHALSLQKEATNRKTAPERLAELAYTSIDLARLVANNPNTSVELLYKLSRSRDVATRHLVATNAKTPPIVLLELMAEFPRSVISNPNFCQICVENPNFLHKISLPILRLSVKQKIAPACFLELAATHWDQEVLLAVAIHPNTPNSVFE